MFSYKICFHDKRGTMIIISIELPWNHYTFNFTCNFMLPTSKSSSSKLKSPSAISSSPWTSLCLMLFIAADVDVFVSRSSSVEVWYVVVDVVVVVLALGASKFSWVLCAMFHLNLLLLYTCSNRQFFLILKSFICNSTLFQVDVKNKMFLLIHRKARQMSLNIWFCFFRW